MRDLGLAIGVALIVAWVAFDASHAPAYAGTTCEDRTARALEEIARQERRQADALERLAAGRR